MRLDDGDFSVDGSRAHFRPRGVVSLHEAVEAIASAIVQCREAGIPELLVDITGLVGFDPPSTGERYVAIGRWAALAGGSVRLAVVARAEMIDAGKFGVIVARNRSLVAEIFTSEAEAAAWLDAPDANGRRGSKA